MAGRAVDFHYFSIFSGLLKNGYTVYRSRKMLVSIRAIMINHDEPSNRVAQHLSKPYLTPQNSALGPGTTVGDLATLVPALPRTRGELVAGGGTWVGTGICNSGCAFWGWELIPPVGNSWWPSGIWKPEFESLSTPPQSPRNPSFRGWNFNCVVVNNSISIQEYLHRIFLELTQQQAIACWPKTRFWLRWSKGLRGLAAEAAGFADRQSSAAALLHALGGGGTHGGHGGHGAIEVDLAKPWKWMAELENWWTVMNMVIFQISLPEETRG